MKPFLCLILLALAPFSAKAEDTTFGDDVKNFVDNEAYSLSKTLAAAHLGEKWAESILSSLQMFQAANTLILDSANALPYPEVKETITLDQAVDVFRKSDQEITALYVLEGDLDRAKAQVDSVVSACNSEYFFSQSSLDQLGNLVMGVGLPNDPNVMYKVEVGADLVTEIMDGISDLFSFLGTSSVKKQKQIASDALATLPQKVVQEQEVFSMSKNTCNAEISFFAPEISSNKETTEATRSVITAKRVALYAIRKVAEQKIVQASVDELSNSIGYSNLLSEVASNDFLGQVEMDLVRAVDQLRAIRIEAESGKTCVARLHAIEKFHDSANELAVVFKTLSDQTRSKELAQKVAFATRSSGQLFSEFAKEETQLKGICQ